MQLCGLIPLSSDSQKGEADKTLREPLKKALQIRPRNIYEFNLFYAAVTMHCG